MQVQVLSDIHFEHHLDGGHSFVGSLDPEGVDVLVLAGDIGIKRGGSLHRGLSLLAQRYGEVPIVMVLGNHEYYHTCKQDLLRHLEAIKRDIPTLTILENDTVTLKGQRFVGCTLWFPDSTANKEHEWWLPDFKCIQGFRNWNYQACAESMEFLAETVREGDFVITHHIPDAAGIHPRYAQPPMGTYNRFFLCQMPLEVLERAAWWAFGHTHDSMGFEIGNCKFRCNPLGYPREGNYRFDGRLVLGGTEAILCGVCKETSEWASDHAWRYGRSVECPTCLCDLTLEGA
jgi:predicted phosphohydrolase